MTPSGSSTTSAADETWTWVGPGRARGCNTYYSSVQYARAARTRIFETGQAVVLASGTDAPWVAQLVSLYEAGVDPSDVDVTRVGRPSPCMMRCALRWMYGAHDAGLSASRRANPHVPRPLVGELYLSDHVELGNENSVAVIEGRAFMCATPRALARFHKNLPKEYWPGDVVALVRCFYGYGAGAPPPIRELRPGELVDFEQTPSTRTDMYNAHRTRIFGRLAAGMKGVGRKRKIRRVVESESEASHVTSVRSVPRHARTTAKQGGVCEEGLKHLGLPVAVIGAEGLDSRSSYKKETVSQSNVTESTGSPDASSSSQVRNGGRTTKPRTKSAPGLVGDELKIKRLDTSPGSIDLFPAAQPGNSAMLIAKPEKTGRRTGSVKREEVEEENEKEIERALKQMRTVKLEEREVEAERPVKQIGGVEREKVQVEIQLKQMGNVEREDAEGEMERSKKQMGNVECEEDEVGVAWAKFKEVIECGTKEQQEALFRKLSKLLKDFMHEIKDKNLSFDADEKHIKEIARVVGRRLLRSLALPSSKIPDKRD